MLFPKKVKYRKMQKGRRRSKGCASRKKELSFGTAGLKVLEVCWITARQIEAARRAITHALKKRGKIWIRVFPDKSISRKGVEVPMGGGKGSVDHYVAPVKPGTIIFELDGIPAELTKEVFRLAAFKLPIKTKVVYK